MIAKRPAFVAVVGDPYPGQPSFAFVYDAVAVGVLEHDARNGDARPAARLDKENWQQRQQTDD